MLGKLRVSISIAVLVIVHVVGLFGMASAYREVFLILTPINLALSFAIMLVNDVRWNAAQWGAIALCFAVGIAVEAIGVATGMVFGDYYYGATLGPKLFEVPIVIGLNWALLVYGSAAITSKLLPGRPVLLHAAIGAAIMVGYDVLMEPVAIALDFWHWPQGSIPLQNYFAWFVVAFGLLVILHRVFKRIYNPVAIALIAIQLVFFGALNFIA